VPKELLPNDATQDGTAGGCDTRASTEPTPKEAGMPDALPDEPRPTEPGLDLGNRSERAMVRLTFATVLLSAVTAAAAIAAVIFSGFQYQETRESSAQDQLRLKAAVDQSAAAVTSADTNKKQVALLAEQLRVSRQALLYNLREVENRERSDARRFDNVQIEIDEIPLDVKAGTKIEAEWHVSNRTPAEINDAQRDQERPEAFGRSWRRWRSHGPRWHA